MCISIFNAMNAYDVTWNFSIKGTAPGISGRLPDLWREAVLPNLWREAVLPDFWREAVLPDLWREADVLQKITFNQNQL